MAAQEAKEQLTIKHLGRRGFWKNLIRKTI
jgi:hypothetical protein